jgi:hypothetical protein
MDSRRLCAAAKAAASGADTLRYPRNSCRSTADVFVKQYPNATYKLGTIIAKQGA